MPHPSRRKSKPYKVTRTWFYLIIAGFCLFALACFFATYFFVIHTGIFEVANADVPYFKVPAHLDVADYDRRIIVLANNGLSSTTDLASIASTSRLLWPVKTVYPKPGALLPFNRIVAYYGNFLSTQMGVLGQYPAEEMLSKLKGEMLSWQQADPSTPVIPAIEYIAVTAQDTAGADGNYIARMPDSQIDHALDLAKQVNGIVILDLQIGFSNLQTEIPLLQKYLKMPQVHLALDPEFSMKTGKKPGTVIGTFDASDIDFAANYLADLVKQYDLPPKILVIHRFTMPMVTNYKNITPLPEVQIVMDMDGWGAPYRKFKTYKDVVYSQPVQFAGIKLFYKNDLLPPSTHMLTPTEVLSLEPKPIFIQYQ